MGRVARGIIHASSLMHIQEESIKGDFAPLVVETLYRLSRYAKKQMATGFQHVTADNRYSTLTSISTE